MGAQVYGISVDSTWAHDAWREKLGLPEDLVLLSDFNRDFGRAYDLLTTTATGMKDVTRRAVLVIGQDGKLVYRWDVPDPPRLPNADEVLEGMRTAA
jgi:glutaredoxin-dependent peroxiredoxin